MRFLVARSFTSDRFGEYVAERVPAFGHASISEAAELTAMPASTVRRVRASVAVQMSLAHAPLRTAILVCAITAHLACKKPVDHSIVQDEPTEKATKAARATAPTVRPAPPDHSLKLGEYVDLDVPSPDRSWVGADYAQAADALELLAKKHPDQLPRATSPRSGRLFERLTDIRDFDNATKGQPPLAQLSAGSPFLTAGGRIMNVYVAAAQTGAVGGKELAGLTAHMTLMGVRVARITAEFMKAAPTEPKSRKMVDDGYAQTMNGLASVVNGCAMSFSERATFDVEDRLLMIDAAQEAFPTVVPLIAPLSQRELRRRLAHALEDETDERVRTKLVALQRSIEKKAPAE